MEITFHVAQRVGVVAHTVLDQIVGLKGHVKGQILLHISGDLSALQGGAVAAGDLFGKGFNIAVELIFGDDLGDEADALCLHTREIPAGERDEEGLLYRYAAVKE